MHYDRNAPRVPGWWPLTSWDAERVADRVAKGTPVAFVEGTASINFGAVDAPVRCPLLSSVSTKLAAWNPWKPHLSRPCDLLAIALLKKLLANIVRRSPCAPGSQAYLNTE
jgi:hypothetical protein